MLNLERNILYYKFDTFCDINFISHCFSTRVGGVSKNEFSELNLGFNRGDKDIDVLMNYFLLFKGANFSGNMVSSKQVHGIKILVAKKEDSYKNFEGYDGFITDEKRVLLTTFHADCVPVFFIDMEKQIIGLAHSGWKGTLEDISTEIIKKMEENFASKKENIRVGIGPAICKECFEVDEDVFLLFKTKYSFIDKYYFKKENKYYVDLRGIIKENLMVYGLAKENIEISSLCTKCREDLFFSHRRDGAKRGSMAAFIELR